jgi:hypothetical protein
MKTSLLLTLLTFLFMATGCEKTTVDNLPSACLASNIEAFKKESLCSDAAVKEYRFQQQLMYVFDHGTCGADLSAKVTDNACNSIGMLGGIAGNTMINGESFANATFIRTVWKK